MADTQPKPDSTDAIRGLYADLWKVTATPFLAMYWSTNGAFLRRRYAADPLAGPVLLALLAGGGAR